MKTREFSPCENVRVLTPGSIILSLHAFSKCSTMFGALVRIVFHDTCIAFMQKGLSFALVGGALEIFVRSVRLRSGCARKI